MKKNLVLLLAAALVFGFTSLATATPITLTDTTMFTSTGTNAAEDYIGHGRGAVNKLSTNLWQAANLDFDYVTWQHQYTFDPAADQLLSGRLTLSFRDDSNKWWDGPEFAFGYAESGDWDFGEVDTGDYSYNIGISTLADGIFQVTTKSALGDFFIDKSVLEITYAPVPEPGTLLLLGSGLAGLAFYRRKKTTK